MRLEVKYNPDFEGGVALKFSDPPLFKLFRYFLNNVIITELRDQKQLGSLEEVCILHAYKETLTVVFNRYIAGVESIIEKFFYIMQLELPENYINEFREDIHPFFRQRTLGYPMDTEENYGRDSKKLYLDRQGEATISDEVIRTLKNFITDAAMQIIETCQHVGFLINPVWDIIFSYVAEEDKVSMVVAPGCKFRLSFCEESRTKTYCDDIDYLKKQLKPYEGYSTSPWSMPISISRSLGSLYIGVNSRLQRPTLRHRATFVILDNDNNLKVFNQDNPNCPLSPYHSLQKIHEFSFLLQYKKPMQLWKWVETTEGLPIGSGRPFHSTRS